MNHPACDLAQSLVKEGHLPFTEDDWKDILAGIVEHCPDNLSYAGTVFLDQDPSWRVLEDDFLKQQWGSAESEVHLYEIDGKMVISIFPYVNVVDIDPLAVGEIRITSIPGNIAG